MAKVVVTLKTIEREALVQLADRERRDPRAQASLIICEELQRRGLLSTGSESQAQTGSGKVGNEPRPA